MKSNEIFSFIKNQYKKLNQNLDNIKIKIINKKELKEKISQENKDMLAYEEILKNLK